MKKLLTLFAILLVSALNAYSVPAYPYPIKVTQPDGTVITIQLHGDEFFNYAIAGDGHQVVQLEDGFYYYYTPDIYVATKSERTLVRAKVNSLRSAQESAFINSLPMGVDPTYYSMGTSAADVKRQMRDASVRPQLAPPYSSAPQRALGDIQFPARGVAILANFADVKFQAKHTKEVFYNLLNQEGYNTNGAVGCASDYFYASTNGQYHPVFDVSSIVTLPENRSYYGGNDSKGQDKAPDVMAAQACQLADDEIDFSLYDEDQDGVIDAVFIFYAGHNEAEGGPAESVWPHRFQVMYADVFLDGLKLYIYACTSELSGSFGTTLAGIGTFSHEYGHVLGLPDYYDTDYQGSSGYCAGIYNLSIMCSGSYNQGGNIPPTYNGIEREFLGVAEVEDITEASAGTYTLEGLSTSNKIYRINSAGGPSEFYLLEALEETPWTKPIGTTGMLISHHDRGTGYTTALRNNKLNVNPYHPYVRWIESYGTVLDANSSNMKLVVYPGTGNRTTFEEGDYGFESWAGDPLPIQLSEITNDNGFVTFYSDGGISVNNLIRIQGRATTATVTYKYGEETGWSLEYRVLDSGDEFITIDDISTNVACLFDLKENTQYEVNIIPNGDAQPLATTFETKTPSTEAVIKVTPGATTATFSYSNGKNNGWSIYLTPKDGGKELSYSNIYQNTYTISNLTPLAGYEYKVVPGMTDDIVMGEFDTEEAINYTYPAIHSIKGTYNVGDEFQLRVGGVTGATVSWMVNEQDYDDRSIITFDSAGSYTIACIIEYADGSEEGIFRIVEVQ